MFTRRRLLELGAAGAGGLLLPGALQAARKRKPRTIIAPPARCQTVPVNVRIAPPGAAEAALAWAPPGYPSYTGYTTVNIANDGSNRSQTLDTATDYILAIDDYNPTVANLGGITITGGRNVVIIGGRIRIENIAVSPTQSTQTAIKVRGSAGTLHIEGLDIAGRNICDAIAIQGGSSGVTSSSILQIQNCRIKTDIPVGQTVAGGFHADCVQWQDPAGRAGTVRFDKNTFQPCYQGFFIAEGGTNEYTEIRRTNFRPVSTTATGDQAHYIFFQELRPDVVSIPNDDLYIETANSVVSFTSQIYPESPNGRVLSDSSDGATVTTDGSGTYATWPAISGITGRVYNGVPAAGDYCPAGVPGIGYVSPGYV